MAGSNVSANDEMIRRLETELREKTTFANEIVHRAQNAERDLTDEEKVLISESRGRMAVLKDQLETIEDVARVSYEAASRAREVGQEIQMLKGRSESSPVEYRSAGAFALDTWKAASGSREAKDRLEMYYRAADHNRTGDEPGVIPDPIVGPVINFIDAARPIVSTLGARPMPYATWHRPLVTQHTSVGKQGSAGAAADEKAELVSQKMTITRLTGQAVTYGGYVNVSRQSIDFSQPGVLDIIINDLAAQYAIDTEAAIAAALATTSTTAVGYGATPTMATVAAAVWKAVAEVYSAVRGQGTLFLACAPDVLPVFGPLFAPYGPFNQQGQGFLANDFAQGVMGVISGVKTVMSAGLSSGEAFLASTAAIEAYEQRVGTLQVVEPSVMGLQVAYAGYFTPLKVIDGGIVPLTAS